MPSLPIVGNHQAPGIPWWFPAAPSLDLGINLPRRLTAATPFDVLAERSRDLIAAVMFRSGGRMLAFTDGMTYWPVG